MTSRQILAFTVLKLPGAAYLVWLGVQAIRHRHDFVGTPDQESGARVLGPLTSVRQGFVVGISNPKALLIIGAVLPQFVDRGVGHVQVQILLLGLVAVTMPLGTVGGLSMVGLGVSLAVSGRTD